MFRTPAIIVKMKATNPKEPTVMYLKNDVVLLAEIIQNYIATCKSE